MNRRIKPKRNMIECNTCIKLISGEKHCFLDERQRCGGEGDILLVAKSSWLSLSTWSMNSLRALFIPLFIPLLNKGDAIATPVTHFCSCIDSALFNLCRFYCGHCLTLCCGLSKSKPFIVILLHFRAPNNLGQKTNDPQELAWV